MVRFVPTAWTFAITAAKYHSRSVYKNFDARDTREETHRDGSSSHSNKESQLK